MNRMLCLLGSTVTLMGVAASAEALPSVTPTAVSCGQTLRKSTTLANDLVNCPATGLKIGADNITVDLNGHTIDGTNARKPGTGGIQTNDHANVTIQNGTITDFHFAGVYLGPRNVARKLMIRNIGGRCKQGEICAGIFLFKAPRATIVDNVVSSHVRAFQVNGIDVYNSPAVRVERNQLLTNAGEGLSVFGSPRSRLIGNELEGNRDGMDVNSSSDSIIVQRNRARANRDTGIAVGANRNARVIGNTVSGNGQVGLLLFDLRNAAARGNRASGNGNGIVLYGGQAGLAGLGGKHGASHNELVGNTATDNSRAGILVRGDSVRESVDRNLLASNVASRNGRKGGIVVEGSAKGNRLRGNTANANAGRGIDAARGAIDGGGNRAAGNQRRPQCVGVRCR